MDDVLAYIADLPQPHRGLMGRLHGIVCQYPGIRAALRYRIPFYGRPHWLCYLNPLRGGGVALEFIRGHEMRQHADLLQARGRKQVRGIILCSMAEIAAAPLLELIDEAATLPPATSPRHMP